MQIDKTNKTDEWNKLLNEAALKVLPDYFARQRWYRSKGQEIQSIAIKDSVHFTFSGNNYLLTFIETKFEKYSEVYFVPFKICAEPLIESQASPFINIRMDEGEYRLSDALQDAPFEKWLFRQMNQNCVVKTQGGIIRFLPKRENIGLSDIQLSEIRNMKAEQSNTSVIAQEKFILKVYRKIEEEMNPEVDMLDYLRKQHFNNVPRLEADIIYQKGSMISSLGLLVNYVKSRSDGWGYVLEKLKEALARVSPDNSDVELGAQVSHALKPLLEETTRIGQLTGALHRTFGAKNSDKRFSPEKITELDCQKWKADFYDLFEPLVREIKSQKDSLPLLVRENLDKIISQENKIRATTDKLSVLSEQELFKIRYHGDFHLGQVLRGPDDWILYDFEGEPLKSIKERKKKAFALKDVAGMLRSFSYAVHVAGEEAISLDNVSAEVVKLLEEICESKLRQTFLAAYFRTMFESEGTEQISVMIRDEIIREQTLCFFELEKAIYEINYELNNRPDWLSVPVQGCLDILQRTTS